MPGTVVVGYDGSESARDALALGEILTEPVRADLIVARVYRWEPAEGRENGSFSELEQAAHSVGGRPAVVASEAPADGLQDLAAELGADLLIVGSAGSGGKHRTVAGEVGLRLLRGAPCRVGLAPRGFARRYAPDIRTVAVGYDGFEEAMAALRHASGLARSLRARLRVIAVVPAKDSAGGELGDRLGDALSSLPAGIESSGVLRCGEPAGVLLDELARGADILAVGSRRHGPPRRVLLGSVSAELVREASCPVLVAPRGNGSG